MRALEVWTGHGSVCTASGECPDEQDEQCAPPAGREAAAEQEDGEEGGGEQLELVQHLPAASGSLRSCVRGPGPGPGPRCGVCCNPSRRPSVRLHSTWYAAASRCAAAA